MTLIENERLVNGRAINSCIGTEANTLALLPRKVWVQHISCRLMHFFPGPPLQTASWLGTADTPAALKCWWVEALLSYLFYWSQVGLHPSKALVWVFNCTTLNECIPSHLMSESKCGWAWLLIGWQRFWSCRSGMGLFQGPHVLHAANAKIPWSILGKPLAVEVSKVVKVTNRQTEGMNLTLGCAL